MCGFVGYIGEKKRDINVLKKMLNSIDHRGPDDFSTYSSGNYNAGMCRLAINDLEKGNQPIFNSSKSISIFYNGEIYNSPELRELLQKKGYRLRSSSDGEVIGHLFDEYNTNCFEMLDGMFSIALWDNLKKELFLVRDPVGEKPLYFYYDSNYRELIFASEIKAISLLNDIDLSLNFQALWDFPTFSWIPEPNTIFKNVKALPKGQILKYSSGKISFIKYSNLTFKSSFLSKSDSEIINDTKNIVESAVKSRLLSDVPLGSFLSGGLDSSIVTKIARMQSGCLSTFSIGFEDIPDHFHGKADESKQAEWFANKLNTKHTTIKVNDKYFYDLLDEYTFYGDQPFAVPSGLGILSISKEAKKQGIKVLLSGDCADECFGGYSWYEHLKLPYNFSKNNGHKDIISMHNNGLSISEKLNFFRNYSPKERAWAWHYYAHEIEKQELFSEDLTREIHSSLDYFSAFNSQNEWDPETYIANDRDFYLTNEMLTKLDRMTMANSIEGRAPFASVSILEHANNLSYKNMVRNGSLKWTLKKAFSDIIPDEILNRPKHGFNVPLDYWFKNSWSSLIDETFSKQSALSSKGFISDDSHKIAKNMLFSENRLNGNTLFSFVILNKWMEKFL